MIPKIIALCLLSSLAAAPLAGAAASTWNTASGDWNVGSYWNGGLPSASGTAVIGNNGTVMLPGGVSGEYGSLEMGVPFGDGGTIEINGGTLSGGGVSLGYVSGGSGAATITSGTWNNSNNLIVGFSGIGVLNLSGGYVSSMGGYIGGFVGYNSEANGVAIVTSGTWNNSNSLYVGNSGTGALTINGGYVSSTRSYVGYSSGSNGTKGNGMATVTSGTWNTSANLNVGAGGTGALTINGGYVSSMHGYIGESTKGNGTAMVTSGTWNNSKNLTVGNSGTGTLTIDGGLVHVSGTTFTGYNSGGQGAIDLSGSNGNRGVLETSRVVRGEGSSEIHFDGGILRALRNESDFISGYQAGDVTIGAGGAYLDTNGLSVGINTALSGTGALHKEGEGTLTLSGSNSYSGGTVLEAGTLIAAHNSALGTGSLTINAGTFSVQTGVILANQIILNGGSLVQVLAPGASLANAVNVTSDAGGETTGATLLDGDASAASNITGHFSAISDAENDTLRLGAVFSLSGVAILDAGTGETDTFVLQLQIANVTSDTRLGWLDPETNLWLNAIEGNIGGTATFLGDKAYDAATDFTLGNYGVDTASGAVWAVLNHNSDFAVVAPVPEPGTWALLALGLGAFLFSKRNARFPRMSRRNSHR